MACTLLVSSLLSALHVFALLLSAGDDIAVGPGMRQHAVHGYLSRLCMRSGHMLFGELRNEI